MSSSAAPSSPAGGDAAASAPSQLALGGARLMASAGVNAVSAGGSSAGASVPSRPHAPVPLRISPSDPLRELFEACKGGDLVRVREMVNPKNVNARDTAGRRSSPLHFAAGEEDVLFVLQLE